MEERGKGLLDESLGSPERLRRVGIEGPKMSVSRMPLRWPRRAKARARFTEARSVEASVWSSGDIGDHTRYCRLSYSAFCRGHGDHLAHISDVASLWETALASRELWGRAGFGQSLE